MARAKLIVGTKSVSLGERLSDPGETVIVSAEFLGNSYFQRLYQGTGVPRKVAAHIMADSVVRFANELSIPIGVEWQATFERQATWETRLEELKRMGDCPPDGGWDLHHESAAVVMGALTRAHDLSTGLGCVKFYTSDSAMTGVTHDNGPPGPGGTSCDVVFYHTFNYKCYKAINKAIGEDEFMLLEAIMPFIKGVDFYLNATNHPGGPVYSGISVGARSRSLLIRGNRVRIARLLSTSAKESVAADHVNDLSADVLGLLLVINVPPDFWGARQVSDISEFYWEAETIFPPYSQFVVESEPCWTSRPPTAILTAIDKYDGV